MPGQKQAVPGRRPGMPTPGYATSPQRSTITLSDFLMSDSICFLNFRKDRNHRELLRKTVLKAVENVFQKLFQRCEIWF